MTQTATITAREVKLAPILVAVAESFLQRLQWTVAELAARPLFFWCLLFAVNAATLPYDGFEHDSRLYGAQVMERVQPGSFGPDLYLKYGSQDRFTIWTLLTAPVVRLLGLPLAYFFLYTICKGVFFAAALRLVHRVVRDDRATVVSLLLLATYELPFGGNRTFRLNESFLTPRILATALVMFSLERMLARRPAVALSLQVAAFAVHPLMALGGLTVYTFWGLVYLLPGWRFAVFFATASIATGVFLNHESWATPILGHMDEDWRDVILAVCYFVRPSLWTAADWTRIALAFAVGACSAITLGTRHRSFLWAVTLAGLAGLIGSIAGERLNYLLLIQASPYRTLWPLQFLCFPLMLLAAARLWDANTPLSRTGSICLLLVAPIDWDYELVLASKATLALLFMATGAAVAAVLAYRAKSAGESQTGDPSWPTWLWHAAAVAFGLAFLYLCVHDITMIRVFALAPAEFHLDLHPLLKLQLISLTLYKLPVVVLILFASRYLLRSRHVAACGLALILCACAYHALIAFGPDSAWFGERFSTRYSHERFVADYVKTHTDHKPTIYWPNDVRHIWFDAESYSYFNLVQLSGCGFDRATAMEGKRRSVNVKPFEIGTLLQSPQRDDGFIAPALFFSGDVPRGKDGFDFLASLPPPNRDDLLGLCRDEILDFVVVEFAIDDLWCAASGRYYIYDCRDLRRRFPAQ